MEKFLIAAWLDGDSGRAAFHERLHREWLPARLADPGVRGLALRERLPGQRTGPDALASLWLDGNPRAAADASNVSKTLHDTAMAIIRKLG